MSETRRLVDKAWSYYNMLRDDGLSTAEFIEQLTYLLFLKVAHERETRPLRPEQILPATCSWQRLLDTEGTEMLVTYRQILEELTRQPGLLGVIYGDARNRIRNPAKFQRLVVDLIDSETWSVTDTGMSGDAYDQLLSRFAEDVKSGAGQYYTPRPLIQAIVDCVQPTIRDTVCDPAAGTSGFLVAAHEYVARDSEALTEVDRRHLRETFVHGTELVDGTARLAAVNLLLHGIGDPTGESLIEVRDALAASAGRRYSVVLSNPPFGRSASPPFLVERSDFVVKTTNKQLNFLQHIATILDIDGRAAVVLPDNALFERGAGEALRRRLLHDFEVHTILRLPPGIFYAGGVKANVLFFDKRLVSGRPLTERLWVYDLRTDLRFTLKRNAIGRQHFDDFVSCYAPGRPRSERAESERFRSFSYDYLLARDNVNLDITWTRDESGTTLRHRERNNHALIQRQLQIAGWELRDPAESILSAESGVVFRDLRMGQGHRRADYVLVVDRRVVGAVETKLEGTQLPGLELQSVMNAYGPPATGQLDAITHNGRLPFYFETNGVEVYFTNGYDPQPRARRIFAIPQPGTLARIIGDAQADPEQPTWRAKVRHLPPLDTTGLRPAQVEMIASIERSLAEQKFDRSLVQMATGTGRTHAAVAACYRLLRYGGFHRILFLVDRNNQVDQVLADFASRRASDDGRSVADFYDISKLTSAGAISNSDVVISTVQRLSKVLSDPGSPVGDSSGSDGRAPDAPVAVEYNREVPPETFDLLFVDDVHRVTEERWRAVLEYFDAHIVGLTATPSVPTLGFFQRNLVSEYTFEQAAVDGVAVPRIPARMHAAYLTHLRERYRTVETSVLTPISAQGEQPPTPLREVFIPQTVRAAEMPDRPMQPVLSVLADSQRVVLLGDPGAGKSTLARYLALALIDQTNGSLAPLEGWLPLLVELRSQAEPARRDLPLLELATHSHSGEGLGLTPSMLDGYLRDDGRALVILDGLDEVLDPQLREVVTRRIAEFAVSYPRARMVVMSRPMGYRRAALDGAGFAHYALQDLDRTQIEAYVTAWCHTARPDNESEAARLRIRLLTAIDSSPLIQELAANPMLLTILAIIGRRGELARKRHVAIEQAVRVLVEHWDVAKHLDSRRVGADMLHLGYHDKLELLGEVARRMRDGSDGPASDGISEQELLEKFEGYLRSRHGLSANQAEPAAKALLDQFRERNHILRPNADGRYGFVRRSFLDYLSAADLADRFHNGELTEDQLLIAVNRNRSEPAWQEALLLVAEMVPERIAVRVAGHVRAADPAVALEQEARSHLYDRRYTQGAECLRRSIELNPSRGAALDAEFGFLKWEGSDRDLLAGIWAPLADLNRFQLAEPESFGLGRLRVSNTSSSTTAGSAASTTSAASPPTPVHASANAAGQTLEEATEQLFTTFFALSEESRSALLNGVRRQRSGTQYGQDVMVTVAGSPHVRCHVECKNIQAPITVKDIGDKLFQQKRYYRDMPFDHWILISPHSDPSNELRDLLDHWAEVDEFPFSVQVWSPESGVEHFFSLAPATYQEIYGRAPTPRTTTDEEVVAAIQGRLAPHLRLAPVWRKYLRNYDRHCIGSEKPEQFGKLYESHVDVKVADAHGSILEGTLMDRVTKWVTDPKVRSLLLLADFGEGKSFFTYCLSRWLSEGLLRNPDAGVLPLRIPLGEFRRGGDGRELLTRRLHEIGATLEEWRTVTTHFPSLLIFDGFDEMSPDISPESVNENILGLESCLREARNSKVLVASRGRVFDAGRNRERILDRLQRPEILHLAPVPRAERIRFLEKFATDPESQRRLLNLRDFYDPIGLAAKPLFLQMIQETLGELPEDGFSELILYRTYVRNSLLHKIELLRHFDVTDAELIDNLQQILEQAAVRLQTDGRPYIYLKDLPDGPQRSMAELLWRTSDGAGSPPRHHTAEDDATARIGIRSLLTGVPAAEDQDRWPVNFFHRSIREYFVGCALVRSLHDDHARAREIVDRIPPLPEITHFVAELLKETSDESPLDLLESFARSATTRLDTRYLGGNALTLLYAATGAVPNADWSGLKLDHALLPGVDLSGTRLVGASLRHANLDNANLDDADIRNADLEGVRLEETSNVVAVSALGDDCVVAAYRDRSVREWRQHPGGGWESRLVGTVEHSIDYLRPSTGGRLLAIGDSMLSVLAVRGGSQLVETRFHTKPPLRSPIIGTTTALFAEELPGGLTRMVWFDHRTGRMLDSHEQEMSVNAYGQCDGIAYAVAREPDAYLVWPSGNGGRVTPVELDLRGVNCMDLWLTEEREMLVVTGHYNGLLTLVRVVGGTATELWRINRHDTIVTSVAFMNTERIISGGNDRAVRITPVAGGLAEEARRWPTMRLTLRCRGTRFEGVSTKRERALLEKYGNA